VTVFGVVAVAGAPKRWLAGLGLAAVSAAFGAIALGLLHGYQLDRFAAFLDPAHDPRGAGYNTTQARIAIGNGGIFGQGLFHGSQTQSGFVPEQHTDFVFTVAGEELGLVGAAALILCFLALLWRALRISARSDDMFGRLAGAGVAVWFGFQAFQNIGMCLGIMPVTGVPLPLSFVRRDVDVRIADGRRAARQHPPSAPSAHSGSVSCCADGSPAPDASEPAPPVDDRRPCPQFVAKLGKREAGSSTGTEACRHRRRRGIRWARDKCRQQHPRGVPAGGGHGRAAAARSGGLVRVGGPERALGVLRSRSRRPPGQPDLHGRRRA